MVYFFDGTIDGFLTAFVTAFQDDNALISSKNIQLPLGQTPVFIQTNKAKAENAAKRLLQFDKNCLQDLDTLLRCGVENNEQIAFLYVRTLANVKRPIRNRLALPEVFHAVACIRKVGLEIHHLHGFIRFMETQSGALYAPFSPDNDVCDLLLPHFRARFSELAFVLHDVSRSKAAVYDGKNTFVAPLEKADVLISSNELEWQALWKQYYKAVNIPERERLKQMRSYLPARYWKFMPEKQ